MRLRFALAVAVLAAGAAGCGEAPPAEAPDEPAFVAVGDDGAAAPAGDKSSSAADERASRPARRFRTAAILRRTTLRASAGGQVVARVRPRAQFGSEGVLAV